MSSVGASQQSLLAAEVTKVLGDEATEIIIARPTGNMPFGIIFSPHDAAVGPVDERSLQLTILPIQYCIQSQPGRIVFMVDLVRPLASGESEVEADSQDTSGLSPGRAPDFLAREGRSFNWSPCRPLNRDAAQAADRGILHIPRLYEHYQKLAIKIAEHVQLSLVRDRTSMQNRFATLENNIRMQLAAGSEDAPSRAGLEAEVEKFLGEAKSQMDEFHGGRIDDTASIVRALGHYVATFISATYTIIVTED